jgi:hypothetical protein
VGTGKYDANPNRRKKATFRMAFTVIGACPTSFYQHAYLVVVAQQPSHKGLTAWVRSASKVHVPFLSYEE